MTIAILAAYLMGSLSSAVIVCKIMGLPDPREQGSKNPGVEPRSHACAKCLA